MTQNDRYNQPKTVANKPKQTDQEKTKKDNMSDRATPEREGKQNQKF